MDAEAVAVFVHDLLQDGEDSLLCGCHRACLDLLDLVWEGGERSLGFLRGAWGRDGLIFSEYVVDGDICVCYRPVFVLGKLSRLSEVLNVRRYLSNHPNVRSNKIRA